MVRKLGSSESAVSNFDYEEIVALSVDLENGFKNWIGLDWSLIVKIDIVQEANFNLARSTSNN